MRAIKGAQATTQNVNIKIDPVVKEAADGVLSGMGLNLSAYIGMCLRQVAQDRKLPFTQTVDPDFWAAEASVSAAKTYIDSGAFEAAIKFLSRLKSDFDGATGRGLLEAWKCTPEEGRNEIRALFSGSFGDYLSSPDLSSVSKIVLQTELFPKSTRQMAEMADNDHQKCFCTTLAKVLESSVTTITDAVDAAFESDALLRDALSCDSTNLAVEEKASAIDSIIAAVVTAVNDHLPNLSLRFMGTSNRSALNDALIYVDSFNKYQYWLSKADERNQQRREEYARGIQSWNDFIKACSGALGIQKLAQVMPKTERNPSPEEMVEQAKPFKKNVCGFA